MVTASNVDLPSTCPSQTAEYVSNAGELEEACLSVTVLYSKVTGQVLCIEAGKEFIDLLLGFLTLPMGCIVKLLGEGSSQEHGLACSPGDEKFGLGIVSSAQSVSSTNSKEENYSKTLQKDQKCREGSPMSSIANIYDSVVKMEEGYLCVEKTLLLDPRPVAAFGGKLLPVSPTKTVKKEKPVEYFCCGIACNFVSVKQGAKCPRHKRKMDTPCKTISEEDIEPAGQSNSAGLEVGYAKDGQFIITNTLEIYPSSAIKNLMQLNMLKSERVADLENMEIFVGADEVLQLLKASLCSGNVLNKVFGKHCPKLSPPPFYVYRHLDSVTPGGRVQYPPSTKGQTKKKNNVNVSQPRPRGSVLREAHLSDQGGWIF